MGVKTALSECICKKEEIKCEWYSAMQRAQFFDYSFFLSISEKRNFVKIWTVV